MSCLNTLLQSSMFLPYSRYWPLFKTQNIAHKQGEVEKDRHTCSFISFIAK